MSVSARQLTRPPSRNPSSLSSLTRKGLCITSPWRVRNSQRSASDTAKPSSRQNSVLFFLLSHGRQREDSVKVALIQLPLQSHDYVYSLENIPLAAGYLKSYASARNAPADIVICP